MQSVGIPPRCGPRTGSLSLSDSCLSSGWSNHSTAIPTTTCVDARHPRSDYLGRRPRSKCTYHAFAKHLASSPLLVPFSSKPAASCTWMTGTLTTTGRSANSSIAVSSSETTCYIPSTFLASPACHVSHMHFRTLDSTGKFQTNAWIERIIFLGFPTNPAKVTISSGGNQATPLHRYDSATQTLIIRRPGPSVTADWTLSIA